MVSAENITIDNSTSIQDSINKINDTGIIYLNSGTYKESGIEINKNITVENLGSKEDVVIDGERKNTIIKINSQSTVKFKNITFINALSNSSGGAIQSVSGSHIILENCNFINNSATGFGGAIYIEGIYHTIAKNRHDCFLNASNCNFINNHADMDGGSFNMKTGNAYFYNSKFIQNYANRDGGALGIIGIAKVHVENCIFKENIAKEWGGGLHNWLGNLNIVNCTIINNTAGTNGGAFYSCAPLTVVDSRIINNTANDTGGVLYSHLEEPKIKPLIIFNNNEIIGNTAKNANLVYFMKMDPNKSNFDNNYWEGINPNSTSWNKEFVTNDVVSNPSKWYEIVPSTINTSNLTRGYNSPYDFIATFTNKYGIALANENIIFKIGNNLYNSTTDFNGVSKLTLKLNVGLYNITLINTKTEEEITRTLTITKRITENKDISKDYLDLNNYKALIIGDDGKPVKSGENVKVILNGKYYNMKTDKNGYIIKNIDLNSGKYSIILNYKGYTISNKIIVKSILKSKNFYVKIKKPIVIKASLKYSNGKIVKNKKIKFSFKGKTYTAKTNNKGIAKISIKNKYNVGKYTVKIKYVNEILKKVVTIKK